MLGRIAGAFIGNKLAGRNDGVRGALLGWGATAIARRGLGPLGAAAVIGWGGKKLYDRYQARKTRPSYPASATPGRR